MKEDLNIIIDLSIIKEEEHNREKTGFHGFTNGSKYEKRWKRHSSMLTQYYYFLDLK